MIAQQLPLDPLDPHAFLQTYVLESYPKYFQQQKRPAVILCPGGSYALLARKEGEPVALKLNTMGYHAFVLHYSVIFREKPVSLSREEELPPVNENGYFPRQLFQLREAIALVRAHAEEWQLDAEQIVLMGFSAGGHLVASYITFGASVLNGQYLPPKAAVLGYSLSDLSVADSEEKRSRPSGRLLRKYKHLCLFRTENPTEEQLRACNPCAHIAPGMPPVFLWHSRTDTEVQASNALNFASGLFAAGVPFELHLYAAGKHGCALADPVCASEKEHYDEGCAAWPDALRIWLKKILTEQPHEAQEEPL